MPTHLPGSPSAPSTAIQIKDPLKSTLARWRQCRSSRLWHRGLCRKRRQLERPTLGLDLRTERGPSSTIGATMPLRRRPAMKVAVFQCACMPARRLPPFGARPRSSAMLVEAQVSSMKISRAGSRSSWHSNHAAAGADRIIAKRLARQAARRHLERRRQVRHRLTGTTSACSKPEETEASAGEPLPTRLVRSPEDHVLLGPLFISARHPRMRRRLLYGSHLRDRPNHFPHCGGVTSWNRLVL
jgi:hypothetical protein